MGNDVESGTKHEWYLAVNGQFCRKCGVIYNSTTGGTSCEWAGMEKPAPKHLGEILAERDTLKARVEELEGLAKEMAGSLRNAKLLLDDIHANHVRCQGLAYAAVVESLSRARDMGIEG